MGNSDSAVADSGTSNRDVVAEFQLTEDEVVRFLRWRFFSRPRSAFLPAVGLATLALGLLDLATGRRNSSAVVFIALGVYELLLVAWIVRQGPRRSWRRSLVLQSRQRFVFNDSGVQLQSPLVQTRVSWQMIRASLEHEGCYALRLTGSSVTGFHLIPRRGFASVEDEMRFRALLQRQTRADLRA
jgi:YcxB-like protein